MFGKLKTKILNRYEGLEIESRLAAALARGAATAAARVIDPTNPISWEFAGFSQHGEDGIHDYLCSKMLQQNRFFFEIGSADGLENCSTWFAMARSYSGVMVEGNPDSSRRCKRVVNGHWICNVHPINMMVSLENITSLMKMCPYKDPDLFIIDIDGVDYHVMQKILEMGFRPKALTVEFNSVFGPDAAITVPYSPTFHRFSGHPSGIYYGASVMAWRKLMDIFGYRFLGVDTSGVNAFFAHPAAYPDGFVNAVRGREFGENVGDVNDATRPFRDSAGDMVLPPRDWRKQFELIKNLLYVNV